MDNTTRAAIRAVVRGLYLTHALNEAQILAIIGELQAEGEHCVAASQLFEANDLFHLADDIGKAAEVKK